MSECILEKQLCIDEVDSYEKLLAYNEKLFENYLKIPFYQLFDDGELTTPKKISRYLDCFQIWSRYFQILMFSRQATCADNKYREIFLEHLQEEFGHDVLLEQRENKKDLHDPILEAICCWFAYKMFILDNIEKTVIVHLVLEISGDYYHRLAKDVIGDVIHSNFIDVHSAVDCHHANMGKDLLKNQTPATYKRLKFILEEAWDVHAAMFDRIIQIVNNEKVFHYVSR